MSYDWLENKTGATSSFPLKEEKMKIKYLLKISLISIFMFLLVSFSVSVSAFSPHHYPQSLRFEECQQYNYYSNYWGIRCMIDFDDNDYTWLQNSLITNGVLVSIPTNSILTSSYGNISSELVIEYTDQSGINISLTEYINGGTFYEPLDKAVDYVLINMMYPHTGYIAPSVFNAFMESFIVSVPTWYYAFETLYWGAFDDGVVSAVNIDLSFEEILSWVFAPFQVFEIELASGITIGHFALVSLVIGLMGFLFTMKKGGK
jgi:hypothetical protein